MSLSKRYRVCHPAIARVLLARVLLALESMGEVSGGFFPWLHEMCALWEGPSGVISLFIPVVLDDSLGLIRDCFFQTMMHDIVLYCFLFSNLLLCSVLYFGVFHFFQTLRCWFFLRKCIVLYYRRFHYLVCIVLVCIDLNGFTIFLI